LKLICDYIDKLYYELFKNLYSALHHDDVELRMFSKILTCIKKSKNDKASGDDDLNNLPKQLKIVIGGKFLGSVFAPLFL
jgi:hypothetical protein